MTTVMGKQLPCLFIIRPCLPRLHYSRQLYSVRAVLVILAEWAATASMFMVVIGTGLKSVNRAQSSPLKQTPPGVFSGV